MRDHEDRQDPAHAIVTEPLGRLIADDVGNPARHLIRRGRRGQIPTLFGRALACDRTHDRCRRTCRAGGKVILGQAVYPNGPFMTPAVSQSVFSSCRP